jgi:hypothetical protein
VRVEIVEAVIRLMQQRIEFAEAGVNALLADGKQLRLCSVDRFLDLRRVLVADPGNPAGGADQVPEDRLALDDPGVLDGVDSRRRRVREARELGSAADALQLFVSIERLRHGDDVDRLATLEQIEDRGVDLAVRLTIEVSRPKKLGDLHDRVPIDEDRTEYRLLGFEALGRQAVDHRLPTLSTNVTAPVSRTPPGVR